MPETLRTFVERRTETWDELAALSGRARRRGGLTADEVRRLGTTYRGTAADLAIARRRFPQDPVTARLEALVAEARPRVYRSVVRRASVLEYVTTGFWRRVRESGRFLAVAAAVLLVPALAIGLWSHAHPDTAGQVAGATPMTAGIARGDSRDPDTQKVTDPATNTSLAAQISTNNARVALSAWAGGLTGGVWTIVSLAFNGLILGLIGGLVVHAGNGTEFLRLVAPHGVLELSLITVAGAAGFRTGWALLRPGHRTRAEALAVEGRAGVEMALGCAVLLLPTGLVEGFVTPRGLSLPAALALGLALAAAFWSTVWWRGRPA